MQAVRPAFETEPVLTDGDAADDPAIWIHPTDPSRSLILGTDKQRGIIAYDLSGRVAHEAPGRINNVDVVQGFAVSGGSVDLALGTERQGNRVAVFTIGEDGFTRADARALAIDGGTVYGLCAMRSARSGHVYVFVSTTADEIHQLRLTANGARIDATLVRRFSVGGHAEGMVADPKTNALYVAEEDLGIWRYEAEPRWLLSGERRQHEELSASESGPRTLVAQVGRDALAADVEGLTIYRGEDRAGYLLAANQGDSTFAVFDADPPNRYLGSFTVGGHGAIDGVSGTDGIEATAVNLGARFPRGVLIVQDDDNAGARQNFKVIAWEEIERAVNLGSPRAR